MYIPKFKKYFTAEKYKPSSEPLASHIPFAGKMSCYGADGRWIIRVVVDEGWGGYDNFLK